MANSLILVVGGARSGKSRFAEDLVRRLPEPVAYIATAQSKDGEMQQRIAKHRASRPQHWLTIEAPTNLADALRNCEGQVGTVLVDCVTLFVSNLLMDQVGELGIDENPLLTDALEPSIDLALAQVIAAAQAFSGYVVIVSNEVGTGLVPTYNLGRLYRDIVGRVNQRLAQAADQVYSVQCGIAVELKACSVTPQQVAERLLRQ